MIPHDYIIEWRREAPWTSQAQVEQDLILSRAIVSIFANRQAAQRLAFRGGTALWKLHLPPAARYSEDIDLVQISPGPIGVAIDAVRQSLDPWLGTPARLIRNDGITLSYRVSADGLPPTSMRIKIEINSREHFTVFGFTEQEMAVRSRWFTGDAAVRTYHLEEILGTKLRALYQRKKGRDLFDLHVAMARGSASSERVVRCFRQYLAFGGLRVTRAELERNLQAKLSDTGFLSDIRPLLAPEMRWSSGDAVEFVHKHILPHCEEEPWSGDDGPTAAA